MLLGLGTCDNGSHQFAMVKVGCMRVWYRISWYHWEKGNTRQSDRARTTLPAAGTSAVTRVGSVALLFNDAHDALVCAQRRVGWRNCSSVWSIGGRSVQLRRL